MLYVMVFRGVTIELIYLSFASILGSGILCIPTTIGSPGTHLISTTIAAQAAAGL